ncbi:MAG TPA: ankyrin repeat domain-containing protein [Bryobacteraceae bacterium]|jgi:hypothetical protein|nr:ankyrin repeat domain-containing protein [Bryobacteraceae bacterium]
MRNRILLITTVMSLALPGQIPDFTPPTPLIGAVLTNDTKAAKKLLDEGTDPNSTPFFGLTPLTIAIISANKPLVTDLLAHGADVNAKDGNGSTTLMWAVGSDTPDLALVDEMLKRGVDPNVQNKFGESALTWAVRRGHTQTIERLKAAGASDVAAIRKSVESAVALLQKSGPQFVKVSGCVSCHHQSLPQMAYAAARDRGLQVDAAVSDQQVKAVLAMFKPIRERLEKGTITLPNPGISIGYSLLGLEAEGYAPDETTKAMTMAIARTQTPDGSFGVMGARAPLEASAFTSTALSIRALQAFGQGYDDKIAMAREWLKRAQPRIQEERSMKLLGLVWSKADAKDIQQAAADLIAQQRPDGGWAQLPGLESDAYATGQAMVALNQAGALSASDKTYQQGVAYLLRTQLADGSWVVRSRSSPFQPLKDSGFPHGRDQWISAAGTSWAAMALSLSQPKTSGQLVSGLF